MSQKCWQNKLSTLLCRGKLHLPVNVFNGFIYTYVGTTNMKAGTWNYKWDYVLGLMMPSCCPMALSNKQPNIPVTFPFKFMLTSATGKDFSYKLFSKFLRWKKKFVQLLMITLFLYCYCCFVFCYLRGRRENWHVQNYLFHP